MRHFRNFTCRLSICICASLPALALAQGAGTDARALSEDRVKIQPVKERTVQGVARKTLLTQAEGRLRARRRVQMELQIPEALRKRALSNIEARITRNLERTRELRREALSLLEQLLSELPPGAAELPATLMRLGELEWEEAREQFLIAFARWERTPTDQRTQPPLPRFAVARARFARVLEQHPDFERYDLALYVDGFLATEEGSTDQALARFNRILTEYPHSPFVPDAHMVRAEAEFAAAAPDYQFAYREYEAVLAHSDTDLHDLALFKSAWALWRLGQTDEAARRFLSVFRAGAERTPAPALGGRRQELDQLQAEALKNLVAVFVEDEKNSADDMHRFLVKAGGARFAGEIVSTLAEALYEQAHYSRGIEAYRLLIQLAPTHEDAYRYGLQIALGHSTLESWDELAKDHVWLLEEYVASGPAESGGVQPKAPSTKERPHAATSTPPASGERPLTHGAWLALQDPATLRKASAAIEERLLEDALGLHAKAQADRTSRVEFESAAASYVAYLTRFGQAPRAYEAQYNLGEIRFHHLGQPSAAADAYLAAVRLKPKGPWSRDALYNALAALASAREAEFQAARAAGQKPEETLTDKQLTQAMELYSSTYPDDRELPELLFRQGRLYYDYELYDPAVRQWGLLLEKHAQSAQARGAGELILDSFNRSRDYQNIETWGRRLLKAPAFSAPAEQARLEQLIVQAIFKQGEQLSLAGEHTASAALYLRAAREFPEDARATQAAVNSAIEAEQAVDLGVLREAAALLTERHSKNPAAARGIWIAARVHQSLGLLEEAAGYYGALARHWPDDEHHQDAAYNAVLLYTALGRRDLAISLGERFQRSYPGVALSDEVTFSMGKAHEQAKDWRAAEKLYARYASSTKLASRRVEALVRLAVARLELTDEKGAAQALERAVAQHKAHERALDDRGKYFGARAHFMQAQRILAEFGRIEITGDAKLLGQRLKRKAELLKRASNALLETAKLGVAEWTTASLYEVGSIYENFARALINSPAPSALSAEGAEQYRSQIDEFVVPIEEKSIEAYESGWNKALELGIFNAWTAKMREALGRLESETYPPLSEVGFRLRAETASRLPRLIPSTRRTALGSSQDFLIAAPAGGARPAPEGQLRDHPKTSQRGSRVSAR